MKALHDAANGLCYHRFDGKYMKEMRELYEKVGAGLYPVWICCHLSNFLITIAKISSERLFEFIQAQIQVHSEDFTVGSNKNIPRKSKNYKFLSNF